MDIDGQRIVITGATSGIGREAALQMAEEGGYVVLLARTESTLNEVADRIRSNGGGARAYPVDLSERSEIEITAEQIRAEVGDPDILVNNAGIGSWLSVPETSPGQAEAMMAVPYFAAFNLTREFLPGMLAQNRGHVVNVTSGAVYAPMPGATAYTASRHAMHGFNEALRLELYSTEIGVTELMPYHVEGTGYTDRNNNVWERTPDAAIFRTVPVETVVEGMIDGIRKNEKRVIQPLEFRLTLLFARLFPGVMNWIDVKTGWQPSLPWTDEDESSEEA